MRHSDCDAFIWDENLILVAVVTILMVLVSTHPFQGLGVVKVSVILVVVSHLMSDKLDLGINLLNITIEVVHIATMN